MRLNRITLLHVNSTHDAKARAHRNRNHNRKKRRTALTAVITRSGPRLGAQNRVSITGALRSSIFGCYGPQQRLENSADVVVQSRAPSPAGSGSGCCQTAATHEEKLYFMKLVSGERSSLRGNSSFRRADAAQVCNDVVFFFADGEFECSLAIAARQKVSERWREWAGLKHHLAATSALHSTKRRVTSRWPWQADKCSGVFPLKESKRINLRKRSFAS